MKTKHEMYLNDKPFTKIKEETKTLELRLNDEKRQLLKIGDLIEFTNRTTLEKMLVIIENLYKFDSFEEYEKQSIILRDFKMNDEIIIDTTDFSKVNFESIMKQIRERITGE